MHPFARLAGGQRTPASCLPAAEHALKCPGDLGGERGVGRARQTGINPYNRNIRNIWFAY
jgi:hypothetical protein